MLHGFRHLAAEEQERALRLRRAEELSAVREPTNQYDPNAIRLWTQDRVSVGYVPRYLAGDACQLLKQCTYFKVFVEQVNPAPAPLQQRVLCRLRSCWPRGFRPCTALFYKPIPADVSDSCAGDQPAP